MDLEKTLQNAILDTYKELRIIFMDSENVKIIFDKIDELIEEIKDSSESFYYKNSLYDKLINLLCLVYSQNKIVTDKLKYSMNEIDLYSLKKMKLKVDQILHYEKLEKVSELTTPMFINKCKELFNIESNDNFDYTLMISNGIVKKEPEQKIINFKIKNTKCVEYNIRALIDKEYINKNYSHTNKSGITKNMVERFKTINMYNSNANDVESTPILSVNDVKKYNKLYQNINDEYVRELVPIKFYQIKDSNNLEDYNDINLIQQIATHLESFEISLLRTNIFNLTGTKKSDNKFSSKSGVIDIYLRDNTIEDSLWKTYNSMVTNNESAVRLATSIYNFTYTVSKKGEGKRFIRNPNYISKLDDLKI
jgi:hypothetical protein